MKHNINMTMKVIKKARHFYGKHNENTGLFLVLIIINSLISLSLPFLTIYIIDELINCKDYIQIIMLIILFCISNMLRAGMDSVINYYNDNIEFKYGKTLEERLMYDLMKKKEPFFHEKSAGELMETISEDSMKLAEFTYLLYKAAAEGSCAIATIIILMYSQWDLMLIILIVMPVIVIFQRRIDEKIERTSEILRELLSEETTLNEEYTSNIESIIMHGLIDRCKYNYKSMISKLTIQYKKLIGLYNYNLGVIRVFMVISITISIAYGGFRVIQGESSIGIIVAFMQYSNIIIEPILTITTIRVMANKLSPSLERINLIYEEELGDDEGKSIGDYHLDVIIDNMCFTYPNGKKVFENAMMTVQAGEKCLIHGKSGVGKSTLISLLLGIWEPNKGVITIGNNPVSELSRKALSEKIAVVSQKSFFFNETIKDCMLSNIDESDESKIKDILKTVGLMDELEINDQKEYTIIGDRGKKLSGGQLQRLALARALIKDSPIIIMDEPTSALDKDNINTVYNIVNNLKDKTIIIISHNLGFKEIVDKTYCIDNYKIIKE